MKITKQILREIILNEIEIRSVIDFIMNNSSLYKQRYIPILKNLSFQKKKNKYTTAKAKAAFVFLADEAEKKFISKISKKDKLEVAKELVHTFEQQYEDQEFDFMKR